MTDPARSLVRKLAEVMAAVDRIPKSGHNNFHNYDYAMEADITSAVRGELAKRQVMMIPSVTKTEFIEGKNAKGNVERIYTVTATFTFHDGESGETLPFVMVGQGSDPSDKGLFKSLTGLVKYAIMKAFLIPTGDDPEKEEAAPLPKPAPAKPSSGPSLAQIEKLSKALATYGVTVEAIEKRIGHALALMTTADYEACRQWGAELKAAAPTTDPDELARRAVKQQAEEAFRSAEKSLASPVAKPDRVAQNAAFEALVKRIHAATSEKEVLLIQAEASAAKWPKTEMAGLARTASGRIFILQELAKGAAPAPAGDVPF